MSVAYDEPFADLYDDIYLRGVGKDYAAESTELTELIRARAPRASSLLDVACGSGEHLRHLRGYFAVTGVEMSDAMARRAEAKLPGVPIHRGDMRDFDLAATYDAVTCLFSAIGYLRGETELHAAVGRMAAHLNPGGVLVVEPWFSPDQWTDGLVMHNVVQTGGRTIVRVSYSGRDGRTSRSTMHYLVGDTGVGVRSMVEEHVLTLFTPGEYRSAFVAAGLVDVATVPGWREGRPRLVATRA